jgi:hypothetical protein
MAPICRKKSQLAERFSVPVSKESDVGSNEKYGGS